MHECQIIVAHSCPEAAGFSRSIFLSVERLCSSITSTHRCRRGTAISYYGDTVTVISVICRDVLTKAQMPAWGIDRNFLRNRCITGFDPYTANLDHAHGQDPKHSPAT